jgi:hypothetical protein
VVIYIITVINYKKFYTISSKFCEELTKLTYFQVIISIGYDTRIYKGKSEGKVVPGLLTEHDTMKAYWGVEVHPSFDIGIRWRSVVIFTLRPLYSQGEKTLIPIG